MSAPDPFVSRFRSMSDRNSTKHWAIIAGSIGLLSVIAANVVDRAARNGALPQIVWHAQLAPPSAGIDYTATGSIAASPRLDPCTGRAK